MCLSHKTGEIVLACEYSEIYLTMENDTRFKIYVSHVPADAAYAEELYQFLRSTLGSNNDLRIYGTRNTSVTQRGSNLLPEWVSEVQSAHIAHIAKALRGCEVVILMLSRNSFSGGQLNEQINLEYIEARNSKRNIICLFIEQMKYFPASLTQQLDLKGDQTDRVFPDNNKAGINFEVLLNNLEKHGAKVATDEIDDGKDYDVFISCKSEDNKFGKTVADFLISKGLNVFFSRDSLPMLGSADYCEQIEDAIENSRNMVVVASSREHANSKWVTFEWRLFNNEKLAGRKDGNLLTILAGGMTVGQLPIALRNLEAIPLVQGAMERLIKYCRKESQHFTQEIFRIDIRRQKIFWGKRPKKHAELVDLGRELRIDGDKKGSVITIWESAQSEEGLRLCNLALPIILRSREIAHSLGIDFTGAIVKDNNGKILKTVL